MEISDPAAVGAEVLPGGWGLTVYAKKESGTAALTVTDYWGYTAYATVQVNDYAAKVTGVVPFSDPKVLNARLHGAKCDGVTDDSAAIRSMIASFGGKGGEILFPAGTYIVSQIILREGVSMRLQGNCKEYLKTGYTDELKEKVESGTEFAVLQAAVNARNNIILNHDPGTNAARLPGDWDHAASNITFEGGMIDLHFFIPSGEQIDVDAYSSNSGGGNSNPVTSSVYFGNSKNNICAFAFSCGKNITVDGVIIKDNYNGHAMQLCAVTDTVVKDCMFAGFTIIPNSPGSVTDLRQDRETIQIEYAHANKSAGAIPPTTFKEGEFYYCQNVTVEGCYFGKSDKAGSQMICIGQHGQNGTANCTGLTIRNNFFDDPYIKGLGLLNYNDVEITGNTFYSEKPDTLGYANMIELRINQGGSSYKYHEGGADQVTVQRAESFEHDGLRNVVIRNNEFIITGNSNKRVLSVWQSGSADLLPGAATVSGRLRRVTTAAIDGSFPGESYTGFVKCTNYVSGLVFSDNRVTVNTAHEGMGDYFAAVGVRVVGMTVENNAVNGSFRDSWNGVPGWNVQKEPFSEAEANGLVFRTSLTDCAVILPDGNGGTVRVASDGSERLLSLLACDHLRLTYTITEAHEVLVNVECEDGFRFAGWKEAIPSLLTSGVTLTARTE